MGLLEEIRNDMAVLSSWSNNIYYEVDALKNTEYQAWCVKYDNEYGVAVERGNYKDEVYLEFSNSKIVTRTLITNEGPKSCIMLLCADAKLRYMFASVCTEFVDPGEHGENRKFLTDDPQGWGMKWRDLLGNAIYHKRIYSVLAEMIALKHSFEKDPTTRWASVNGSTHDIECTNMSIEVKSTLRRYGTDITISGQHQLQSRKKLELYFIRLEQSKLGICINDMVQELIKVGYDSGKIEQELKKQGIMLGSPERKERYKILEKRKYIVDDKFPRITNDSFKSGKIPENIIHIVYTINLGGLPFEKW